MMAIRYAGPPIAARTTGAVVSARELDYECDDDRDDHRESGDRGGVDVDLAGAFVAAVAAQSADRLATPAEENQRAERGHDPE
jgi:hypothetical protein